eukprot:Gregarina_sp_Poly_1__6024@NODE_3178_length_1298_cov_12_658002_g2019_i0_p1_GENE_NODE_3178_length_1298_cov_12_658002_g2019_i0NODE_3178_length_1298_cov_12_658002_g2019_i0_p1_ORF_typecomplete_len212_score15_98_NODE_3178_length_1298_cov_12_658002_g2019_i0173808
MSLCTDSFGILASIASWINEIIQGLVILTVLSWQDGLGASVRSWDVVEVRRHRVNTKVPFWHIDKSHLWSATELARQNSRNFPEAILLIDPTFTDWNSSPCSLDRNLMVSALHTYSRGLLLGLADNQSHIARSIREKERSDDDIDIRSRQRLPRWMASIWIAGNRCIEFAVDLVTNRAPPADTWEESGRYDHELVVRYHRLAEPQRASQFV